MSESLRVRLIFDFTRGRMIPSWVLIVGYESGFAKSSGLASHMLPLRFEPLELPQTKESAISNQKSENTNKQHEVSPIAAHLEAFTSCTRQSLARSFFYPVSIHSHHIHRHS
jgi:hypothetical protein